MLLHYKEYGQGQPLLILHGYLGCLDNWQTLAKVFAQNFRVLSIDLRNHGRSFHSPVFNYNAMAQDIESLVSDLSLESCIVLGHSMGGKVCMNLLSRNRIKIKKSIIVDIAPKEYPRGHDQILKALQTLDLVNCQSRQEITRHFENQGISPLITLFLAKNIDRSDNNKFIWKINLPVLVQEYDEIRKEIHFNNPIKTPCLFVKGEKSDYILDSDWHSITKSFLNTTLSVIPQAGHWVHAEQTTDFITAVQAFLSDFTN